MIRARKETTDEGEDAWDVDCITLKGVMALPIVYIGALRKTNMQSPFKDWRLEPGVTVIESFSKPVTDVPFPSITLCNEQGLDTGEYVRNVFNNLAFTYDEGNKSAALREAFESVLDTFTYQNTTDSDNNPVKQHSLVVGNFMFFWLRYTRLDVKSCTG